MWPTKNDPVIVTTLHVRERERERGPMATKKLTRLQLSDEVSNALGRVSRKGVRLATTGDVLNHTVFELVQLLDISEREAKQLVAAVTEAVTPKPTNALALLRAQSQKIATGVPDLDRAICGGIRCGELTEITGTPGSGKTQLCLSLACSAMCKGLVNQRGAGTVSARMGNCTLVAD